MTTLREAAQAVLNRWDSPAWEWLKQGPTAALMADLRAALAEPENWELRRLREELERCRRTCAATSEAWREESALAEPVQEPVAWIHIDPDKPRVKFLEWREDEPGYRGRWIKTPLYTAPPQRKPPIADEALWEMWVDLPSDVLAFARRIEMWHGITGGSNE